jgi:hypothetical protein
VEYELEQKSPLVDMGSPQSATERRRVTRTAVRYLRFYSPIPGTILNLSETGMCLETVAELPVEAEYLFKVRWASMLFTVKGRVEWSRLRSPLSSSMGTSLNLYRCGISFANPLREETLEFLTQSG